MSNPKQLAHVTSFYIRNQELEVAHAADAAWLGHEAHRLNFLERVRVEPFEGDHDIFGDGKAVLLDLPGHTAGSQVLVRTTGSGGCLMLSGDLSYTSQGWQERTVPMINQDPVATMWSSASRRSA